MPTQPPLSRQLATACTFSAVLCAVLLTGCSRREVEVPKMAPQVAVDAPAPADITSAPVAVVVPPKAAAAVLPTVFGQPASSASVVPAPASDEQLSVAMWAGIKSSLQPLPAESFANSYEQFAAHAHAVLDGNPPADIQKLTTSPWTKNVVYLPVDKRTVLFAVLVEFQGQQDVTKTRRVMPIVTQLSESGQMLVASVDGITGLGRADRFLQVWPTASQPVNLKDPDFARMRGHIAAALAQ